MKASEIFEQIGNQLAEHYKHLDFKYTKKWGTRKVTKNYEYEISFHSAEGNTKNRVSLFVSFLINCRTVKDEWDNFENLIGFSLWDLGYYYQIGESHTLEQACDDIVKHADILLIPFIDIFENQSKNHLQQWVAEGFTSRIPAELYHYPFLDYTTHKHYWIGTEFMKNHNEFGFEISLRYIYEMFGREYAEQCLNNYYQSLNEEAQRHFLNAYECEILDIVEPEKAHTWDMSYKNFPNVGKVKYAAKQNLKLARFDR